MTKIQVDVGTQVDLFSNFTTQKMNFDLSLVETMKNVGPFSKRIIKISIKVEKGPKFVKNIEIIEFFWEQKIIGKNIHWQRGSFNQKVQKL